MNWHTCVSQLLNILWLMRHKTPPGQNSHHENAMYWREEDGFIDADDKQSWYCKNSPALLFWIFFGGKLGFIQPNSPPDAAWSKAERGELVFLCLAPFLPSVVFLSKSKHRVTVPGASATPPMPSSSDHPQSNWSPGKARAKKEILMQKEKTLCKRRKHRAKKRNPLAKRENLVQ